MYFVYPDEDACHGIYPALYHVPDLVKAVSINRLGGCHFD